MMVGSRGSTVRPTTTTQAWRVGSVQSFMGNYAMYKTASARPRWRESLGGRHIDLALAEGLGNLREALGGVGSRHPPWRRAERAGDVAALWCVFGPH